jgi:hypothetical protein
MIGDADEDRALGRQLLSSGDLRFGEGFAEVVRDAHDFARRPHLGTENGIDSGKFAPGKDGRLHIVVAAGIQVGAALDVLR